MIQREFGVDGFLKCVRNGNLIQYHILHRVRRESLSELQSLNRN